MHTFAWPAIAGLLLIVCMLLLIGLDGIWRRLRATPPAHPPDQEVSSPPPLPTQPRRSDRTKRSGEEVITRTCVLCRFPTELDDVAVGRGASGCVCLRCFARVTGTERPMPAALRRALSAVLTEVPAP